MDRTLSVVTWEGLALGFTVSVLLNFEGLKNLEKRGVEKWWRIKNREKGGIENEAQCFTKKGGIEKCCKNNEIMENKISRKWRHRKWRE